MACFACLLIPNRDLKVCSNAYDTYCLEASLLAATFLQALLHLCVVSSKHKFAEKDLPQYLQKVHQ